jgi:hypothetical protein
MISGTRQLNGRRIGLLLATLTAALLAAFALVLMASNNPAQAATVIKTVQAEDSTPLATGLFVDEGDRVVITASGKIDNNDPDPACPNADVGPNGIAGETATGVPPGTLPTTNVGALLGKIDGGNWFVIGDSKTFTASTSGELFLIVNDSDYSDNCGSFKVTIDVNPPSPPPPPPTDTTRPRVIDTVPTAGAKGVGPDVNIKAFFSEDMLASTINSQTFELFKNGSTKVGATVSYNAKEDRAKLDPNNPLRSGATYKAVVTTGAKDEAGNRLDQNRSLSGLQKKKWFFTISD